MKKKILLLCLLVIALLPILQVQALTTCPVCHEGVMVLYAWEHYGPPGAAPELQADRQRQECSVCGYYTYVYRDCIHY